MGRRPPTIAATVRRDRERFPVGATAEDGS